MSICNVELKKVVDDSYEIEIGFDLMDKLIDDLKSGLVGKINKFVIITDDNVKKLYAIYFYEKLISSGFKSDFISFEAGDKSKTRETKAMIEDAMLE